MNKEPQILNLKRRGLMLVLSSPSGAGKSTINRHILQTDSNVKLSISATSRCPRIGEEHGVHYYFHSTDIFQQMIEEGALLEYAEVFGKFYGTPREPIFTALDAGQDVLFDIDWQGTRQLRAQASKDLVSIFILPPSLEELEHRLRSRRQDDEVTIQYRMTRAKNEISHYDEYDYIVVNDDLNSSVRKVQSILAAERHKRKRQTGLSDFVHSL